MNVKLIAVTKPMVDGINTADELISYCARVSNPANQLNVETAPRLLRYCVKHGHWSIFETASMTVEIVTSRAIAAQLLRHRSFTFQEFSQRYAESQTYEITELRTQDAKNRQGSGVVIDDNQLKKNVDNAVLTSFICYKILIESGVSKETARMVLPLCTQTTLYMTGNVRSWIHYLEQRCAEGTQKEHREVAQTVKEIFTVQFPTVAEAVWTTKQE
jgi:thymidylate synthase (FAD)